VRLGEDGYLRVAPGGSVVPAAATADDLGDYIKATAMKDSIGVQEMFRQGRLMDIAGDTRVHVIDADARLAVGISRVRVLEGPLAGTAVWVLDNSLASGKATGAPSPQPTQAARSLPAVAATVAVPTSIFDESFGSAPQGWPNQPFGTAWFADGAYRLEPREAGHFVAIDAPLANIVDDVVVLARFHKTGGPPGGGYGLLVADQGPDAHDGVNQGGQFVVLEAGDQGTVGAWRREKNHWIDLQPWTPSSAVRQDEAVNELMVRTQGQLLTFFVNGTQVAQVTAGLAAGRVGIFVGGDGNEVTLERFTVQPAAATVPSSARSSTMATPNATATPKVPPTPAGTPTPAVDVLLGQLDSAWTHGDWSKVLGLLDHIEQVAPSALNFQDKRYAAHVAAGQDLLAKGNTTSAVGEFVKAEGIDPGRGEAPAALIGLTPTPTPVPSLPSANKPLSQFAGAVLDDVENFWSKYFNQRGAHYTPATRHWYQQRTKTACGVAVPGVVGPFYCGLDSGLYP
jgi:hypothetical protein